jgi:hypothetical protein
MWGRQSYRLAIIILKTMLVMGMEMTGLFAIRHFLRYDYTEICR